MPQIRIKYFTDAIERLTYIDGKSDWIDLRASESGGVLSDSTRRCHGASGGL